MKQADIQFASLADLKEFIRCTNPFIVTEEGTTISGLFTEIQLELALNGYGAKVFSFYMN